jgi:hypothetical protein
LPSFSPPPPIKAGIRNADTHSGGSG